MDVAHRLGEPRYICVSLYCFNLFCILFINLTVYLLLLCSPVFLIEVPKHLDGYLLVILFESRYVPTMVYCMVEVDVN